MRILYVLTGIGVLPERLENVSGHVQIPLKTCELMRDSGHEVSIVATAQSDGTAMPACLPEGVHVDLVTDGRRRGQLGKQNARDGIYIFAAIKQVLETILLIHRLKPDVIHVFGFERMVALAGVLKLCSLNTPVFVTVLGRPPRSFLTWLYRRVNRVLALTDSVARDWFDAVSDVHVIRPGVVRHLGQHNMRGNLDRVLFWREASKFGGGDLCLDVFDELAPLFPHVEFSFAVRHNKDEVKDLEKIADRHPNLSVHRFPYSNGETLEQMIQSSLCVVLPFRALSIEPQMTVVETLATGCPVITSDVRCLPELVQHGKNGIVIESGSKEQLREALESVLNGDFEFAWERERIASEFEQVWNWNTYTSSLTEIYASYESC